MTRRQKQCLDFIKGFIAEHGRSPLFKEMVSGLGLASKSGVFRLVRALEERGEIFIRPRYTIYEGINPIHHRDISIFHEISRGPDGITKYAAWPS